MNTALDRRLKALETHHTPEADRVQVIFFVAAGELTNDATRAALVLGGQHLSRNEGEALSDFKARVEVERLRVCTTSGQKPKGAEQ